MQTISFLDLKLLNKPYMAEISQAVQDIVTSGWYVGGKACTTFEHQLAAYQGIEHVVGVSNGLDALRLILEGYIALGRLHKGDEIIVPANTYIASILAIDHAGLTPVLVEPSQHTLNLDTQLIEQAITPLTRAIMVVHLYGRTCWDEHLVDLAHRHNLLIIEDNAQSIGAHSAVAGLYGHHIAGSLGDAAAFSFYPTKNLGAMGDAGAVATHNHELADAIRALSNYGSDRRYHNIYTGYNCRLDPVQAALLNIKLKYLDSDNDRRREIATMYASRVNNKLITIYNAPGAESNYHQLVALCTSRDKLRQYLAANGVGTDVLYPTPPHRQPCYKGRWNDDDYPITNHLADNIISLPVAPYLTNNQVEYIIGLLNSY